MRLLLLLFTLVGLLSPLFLGEAQACVEDPRYFGTSPINIYVRATGSDANPTCGETTATACLTIAAAVRQVPTRWTAPVSVEVGPGTFEYPTAYIDITPGAYTSVATVKEGTLTIRGACEAPLATWATAAGVAIPGRYAQKDFTTGGWTGTIGNGTHYVRYPTTSPVSPTFYAVTRTSTSPTLRLVNESTSIANGLLCAWETVITNPLPARYAAPLSLFKNTVVGFAGIKFTTAVEFMRLRLEGIHVVGPKSASLVEVSIRGAYFDYAATTYSTSDTMGPQLYNGVLWNGCPQFRGQFLIVSGVVIGSCPVQGQLSIGVFNEDPPVYGSHQIRNFGSFDFEGTGTCLKAYKSTMRLGTSASGMSCNTALGGFLMMDHNSTFSFNAGALATGTTAAPSQVMNASFLGPMGTGYQVVNSGSGGDFTIGATVGVATASLPVTDPVELSRVYK